MWVLRFLNMIVNMISNMILPTLGMHIHRWWRFWVNRPNPNITTRRWVGIGAEICHKIDIIVSKMLVAEKPRSKKPSPTEVPETMDPEGLRTLPGAPRGVVFQVRLQQGWPSGEERGPAGPATGP